VEVSSPLKTPLCPCRPTNSGRLAIAQARKQGFDSLQIKDEGGEILEFHEFLTKSATEKELHPERRMGQTYFNVLFAFNPELADSVSGTSFDPYYEDDKIGAFLNHVCQEWR
jgi:hypothetical protein